MWGWGGGGKTDILSWRQGETDILSEGAGRLIYFQGSEARGLKLSGWGGGGGGRLIYFQGTGESDILSGGGRGEVYFQRRRGGD